MPAVPYTLAERTYPTKKAAREAIRAVLRGYRPGQTLTAEDMALVYSLLEKHPEAGRKIGCGVASIQVEFNGAAPGFWITRVDGSRTDFSYLACFNPPTPARDAIAALRLEVRDQVVAFRNATFGSRAFSRCAVTGESVAITECHVDHEAPTFNELVAQFLAIQGIAFNQIAVEPGRDGDLETRLADPVLAKAWQAYHAEHARLRVVTREAHISLSRRRR